MCYNSDEDVMYPWDMNEEPSSLLGDDDDCERCGEVSDYMCDTCADYVCEDCAIDCVECEKDDSAHCVQCAEAIVCEGCDVQLCSRCIWDPTIPFCYPCLDKRDIALAWALEQCHGISNMPWKDILEMLLNVGNDV
jgi:hypothetical protein